MLRFLAGASACLLLCAGLVLGYIAIVAVWQQEGVFLPSAYVALFCLTGAWLLGRRALGRPAR